MMSTFVGEGVRSFHGDRALSSPSVQGNDIPILEADPDPCLSAHAPPPPDHKNFLGGCGLNDMRAHRTQSPK